MTREIPSGVIAMLVTPFDKDGRINFTALGEEIAWCVSAFGFSCAVSFSGIAAVGLRYGAHAATRTHSDRLPLGYR